MIKWEEGRQGSGYYKTKIFESKFLKMDCYILKFPEGSYVDTHIDPVEGYEHHRFNVILKRADVGGIFFRYIKSWNNMYPILGRVIKFRPDIQKHNVSRIEKGTRYVLSIGWLRGSK